ncbi:MAG: hypothetical protein ACI8RT_001414 [Candidatus Azotimanducaceae bacterium]|jgi:hypothetical protein|tara:strand:- start:135 stop:638 length:504 start_codon:yes stop_codon:yes gene_type:complete
MQALFSIFWRITSLQAGPETVPASSNLLALVTISNIIVSLAISLALGDKAFFTVAATIVINLAALSLIMAGLLAMVGKSARLSQTLTAYFGCDLLLNVFVAIAISLSKLAGVDLLNNIALIILVWSVAVFGFILSRALEVHMILGSVLALVLIILTFSISQIAIGNS